MDGLGGTYGDSGFGELGSWEATSNVCIERAERGGEESCGV